MSRAYAVDQAAREILLVLLEEKSALSRREIEGRLTGHRRKLVEPALRALVIRSEVKREVRKSYETKGLAGREFGGVVTMRRHRAYYSIA